MRKLAMLFAILCLAVPAALAQTTAVTATLTDPAGSTWVAGTCTAQWTGTGNPSTTSGQSFNTKPACTVNGSGVMSVTVTDVAYIAPPAASWKFCATPGVVAPTAQYCVTVAATGASESISAQIQAVLVAPSVTGGPLAQAYADSEVTAVNGNQYYNLTSNTFRCYAAGAWGGCAQGAGGGFTLATPNGTLSLNAACASGGACTADVNPADVVTSFNTRTGAVTLTAADVNAVGAITNATTGNAATATALSNLGSGSAISPPLYLMSLLNTADITGPQTYLTSTLTAGQFFTSPQGGDIYTDATGFRDPRILHYGSNYFLAYTNLTGTGSGAVNNIGLAKSSDLQNWTDLTSTTPNWSAYFTGSENAVWNGSWFTDPVSGTVYFFFATCLYSTPVCTPYQVTFNPANQTFGTPTAITLSPTRAYSDVMSVWYESGTYYALDQSLVSGTYYIELLSTTSLSSASWTISGTSNWASWGGALEGGATAINNGTLYAFFVTYGGGSLYYSTCSTPAAPTSCTWSAKTIVPTLRTVYTGTAGTIDWVDMAQLEDLQSLSNLHQLILSGSTITQFNPQAIDYPQGGSVYAPNLPSGGTDNLSSNLGVNTSNYNMAYWAFFYHGGTGSSSNYGGLGISGFNPSISWFGNGGVTVGGGSSPATPPANSAAATAFEAIGTKFTVFGCSVSATTGAASAGVMTLGANTCSVVITMNGATGVSAAHGWSCHANDETTAAGNPVYETGSTATTATLAVSALAGSTDVVDFACLAY